MDQKLRRHVLVHQMEASYYWKIFDFTSKKKEKGLMMLEIKLKLILLRYIACNVNPISPRGGGYIKTTKL